jgi:hypothetical protein
MRCPTCLYEGTPHSVRAYGPPRHDGELPAEEFWDESGQHHVHDATRHFGQFGCSNGHEWSIEHITRCPQFSCSCNLRPATRAQLDVQIPGWNPKETMAEFRSRKISQFIRLKKRLPSLRMEESGLFFCTFTAIDDSDPAIMTRIEFGSIPVERKDRMFIDLTDKEIITYFNGGPDA